MTRIRNKLHRCLNPEEAKDFVRSYSCLRHFPEPCIPAFVDQVKDVIQKNHFDLIQIEFFELLALVEVLPEDITKIFIHHELNYIRAEREMALFTYHSSFDPDRFRKRKEYEFFRLKKYDAIVALTAHDQNILTHDLPQQQIFLSPPAIPVSFSSEPPSVFTFANKLVFMGSPSHFPNLDGLKWFVENVFSLICQANPRIKLYALGNWTAYTRKLLAHPNLVFPGYVEDISALIEGSFFIVPIRIGSGIRMKILDAVTRYIPFITTTIGVEGLAFTDNVDCLIADRSEDFAQKIIALSQDNIRAQQIVFHAAKKLNDLYSFKSAVVARQDLYRKWEKHE